MRRIATLGIMFSFAAALCHAERFTGKLMDAACYNTNKVASQESGHKTYRSITKTCAPTDVHISLSGKLLGETLKDVSVQAEPK